MHQKEPLHQGSRALTEAFQQTSVPAYLEARITASIAAAAHRRRVLRFALFGTSLGISFTSLPFLIRDVAQSFAASGFWEYAKLTFSEGGAVTTIWRDILSTLIELAPLTEIAVILALTAAALWSLMALLMESGGRRSAGLRYS